MSTPTTDEGAKGSPARVHGTLGPDGLTSTPTTLWVLIIYPTGNNDTSQVKLLGEGRHSTLGHSMTDKHYERSQSCNLAGRRGLRRGRVGGGTTVSATSSCKGVRQGIKRSTWTVCFLFVLTFCTTTTIVVLNSTMRQGPDHDLVNFLDLERSKGRGQYSHTN